MKIIGTAEYQQIKANFNCIRSDLHNLESNFYQNRNDNDFRVHNINEALARLKKTIEDIHRKVDYLSIRVDALYDSAILTDDVDMSVEEKYREWEF